MIIIPILAASLQAASPAPAPPAQPALRSPSDAIAAAAPADWQDVDPADLLLFEFDGGRSVAVQLAPQFAPDHIANIKKIVRSSHWANATIYRVADNWVTQWGAGEDEQERSPPLPKDVKEQPDEEYSRPAEGLTILPSGSVDPYSQLAGFAFNWPIAMHADGRVNLAFCYGTVGVARGPAPDTGAGSELFAMIGAGSRRLDRNFAAVGRVLSGMEHLSALPRGTAPLGFYAPNQAKIPLRSVKIASDLPAAQRPRYQVMKQSSRAFADYLELASHRKDYGFGSAGAALCGVPVPVRSAP
jgi:peptidylprolyl isomerase